MRCFDKKRSNKFSQNCAAWRRPNYTFSSASFNFTFVTRDFLCSLLLLHCASFVLLKLLFSFFLMTFSVSTVHFQTLPPVSVISGTISPSLLWAFQLLAAMSVFCCQNKGLKEPTLSQFPSAKFKIFVDD